MTDVVRPKVGTRTSASTDYTVSFDVAGQNTPLDSTHGIFAYVQRTGTSGSDPTPTAIDANWVEVPGSAGLTGGTTKTFTGLYVIRGNGTVNSFNVKGTAATTQVILLGCNPIPTGSDWYTNAVVVVNASTTGPLSATITGLVASQTVIGFGSVGGTFGEIPTWTGLDIHSGSTSSGASWADKEVTAAGSLTATIDWLNTNVARLTLVAIKVPAGAGASVIRNSSNEHVEDFSESVGVASIALASQTGAPVDVEITGLKARFPDSAARTTSVTLTFTVTLTAGGTQASTVTVPPLQGVGGGTVGYEEVVMQGETWV